MHCQLLRGIGQPVSQTLSVKQELCARSAPARRCARAEREIQGVFWYREGTGQRVGVPPNVSLERFGSEATIEEMREALGELDVVDDEHPDVSLTHEPGFQVIARPRCQRETF